MGPRWSRRDGREYCGFVCVRAGRSPVDHHHGRVYIVECLHAIEFCAF